MSEGIEDYSHQIGGMIGLINASNIIQDEGHCGESQYYQPIEDCNRTKSSRWVLVEERTRPSRAKINKSELEVYDGILSPSKLLNVAASCFIY
ncbi:putative pectin methyltransferase QUA2, partial [Cucurbita argyrosperma subsp. sororia]